MSGYWTQFLPREKGERERGREGERGRGREGGREGGRERERERGREREKGREREGERERGRESGREGERQRGRVRVGLLFTVVCICFLPDMVFKPHTHTGSGLSAKVCHLGDAERGSKVPSSR